MKKILLKMIIMILSFSYCVVGIKAASMSLSASSANVTVGSTVTIYPKTSGLSGKFNITSSDSSILSGGTTSGWCEGTTCDFNGLSYVIFKATNVGTATITFSTSVVSISEGEGGEYSDSRSITINVVNKAGGNSSNNGSGRNNSIDINKKYSSNNYLSSLSIDGYTLTPEFNKDTFEYSVELQPGTETVNINAEAEDDTASIRGDGEVSVSEGINTIEVVVTAENGNEKIYVIKANVEEKDPIVVKMKKSKYTVVKKAELLVKPEGYEETTVKIKNFDIPAFYNPVTKVTLVGLKDKDGNIKLYSYDTSNGKYSNYAEFKFNVMNLYIHDAKKNKYEKVKIKINDQEVTAYKLEGISGYYLLYATNTLTGNEGYYLYDVDENSVQRYNTDMLDKITHQRDKYLSIVLVLSSVCFLCMLFLLIEINKKNEPEL